MSALVDDMTPLQRKRFSYPNPDSVKIDNIADSDLDNNFLIPSYDMHAMPDQAYVYPSEGKMHWDVPGVAQEFERMRMGMHIHPWHKYPIKTALRQSQVINKTGKDIYARVNGLQTGRQVYESLIKHYQEPSGKHLDAVRSFYRGMIAKGHVSLSTTPVPKSVVQTGSDLHFVPVNVSIETTANCNIKCRHCYGTFEQSRFDAIGTNELIDGLAKMKAAGLRTVELTGGECTTHPEFAQILKYCAENFDLVAILTNAVSIKNEVFEVVSNHASNVCVQICINGTQAYHDYFTKAPNSYKRAMAAMRRFAEMGIFIRTPMNLSIENFSQLEETCEAVRDAGSGQFMANFIDMSYGRATDFNQESLPIGATQVHSEEDCEVAKRYKLFKDMDLLMTKLIAQYPGYIAYKYDGDILKQMEYDQSCGAGRRSLYIASNGRVGLCPMSVETGIPGYGTLDSDNGLDDILDSAFAKQLSGLPAPNPKDCAGCPYELEHRGCLLQGIRQAMKTPQNCHWGKIHDVATLVKNGHHSLKKLADGTFDVPEISCGQGCGSKGGGCGSKSDGVVQIGNLNAK